MSSGDGELQKQAKPIRNLIAHARERDELGKQRATRAQLLTALMTLGNSRKDAERILNNARKRVRNAANKAEERLDGMLASVTPWQWTDPYPAILMMRRDFFPDYEDAPLTDIENDLIDKGNVLFILAIYPTLRNSIARRLTRRGVENVQPDDRLVPITDNNPD